MPKGGVGIYDSMHPWLSLLWWRHELASLEFRLLWRSSDDFLVFISVAISAMFPAFGG